MTFPIDFDKTNKIYLLTTLDPKDGRDDEAERLILPFAHKGFRFNNQLVFVTDSSITAITDHIRRKKSSDFQFFLIDLTDNFEKGTFVGNLNKKHFPIAKEAQEIMSVFKPILPELSPEQKADALFDKINQHGINSLTPKEKKFLDSFSQK